MTEEEIKAYAKENDLEEQDLLDILSIFKFIREGGTDKDALAKVKAFANRETAI